MKRDDSSRHCASCYGQYDGGGIDFEAAFDGPTLAGVEVAVGQPMAIDDLYVCRRCLTNAAALLEPPLVNAPELLERKRELEAKVAELEEYERANVKVLADLQRANDALLARAGGKPGPVVQHAREVAAESARLRQEREEQAGAIPRKEPEPAVA